jgi:type II secretion system protein J
MRSSAIESGTIRGRAFRSGFTLVELLIGIIVVSGVLAGAYVCLQAGLESQRTAEERMEIIQSGRVALELMAADLRSACSLGQDLDFVGMDRTLDGAEADNLDFATHNWRPEAPGEGDFCEVSYFADRDPRTGELGLWRRRDPSPDEDPLAGGTREEIVPGLRWLRLEYYDGLGWWSEWGDTDSASGVPRLAGNAPARGAPAGNSAAGNRASGNSPAITSPDGNSATSQASLTSFGLPDAVRITLALGPPGRPPEGLPGRSPARGSGSVSREEGPILFQTTVRLNLVERSSSSFSSSASSSTAPSASSETGAGPGSPEGR